MSIFGNLKAVGKPSENILHGYPLHFIDGDTGVFKGSINPIEWGDGGITTLWAHVVMDIDGDDWLEVNMLGNRWHDGGAFGGDTSWAEFLNCDGYNAHYENTNALQWMLQNGIAPGQRAWLEVIVEWSGGSYYEPYDVDCSFSHRVMWIEPWPVERIIAAWKEYLTRVPMEEDSDES